MTLQNESWYKNQEVSGLLSWGFPADLFTKIRAYFIGNSYKGLLYKKNSVLALRIPRAFFFFFSQLLIFFIQIIGLFFLNPNDTMMWYMMCSYAFLPPAKVDHNNLLHPTWTWRVTLRECSLSSPVPLTHFNLQYHVENSGKQRKQWPGFWLPENRQKCVRLKACVSEWVVTAVLQWTVLSLFLFTVHLRLTVPVRALSSPEILRWLCSCALCLRWTGSWVQGTAGPLRWRGVGTITSS